MDYPQYNVEELTSLLDDVSGSEIPALFAKYKAKLACSGYVVHRTGNELKNSKIKSQQNQDEIEI